MTRNSAHKQHTCSDFQDFSFLSLYSQPFWDAAEEAFSSEGNTDGATFFTASANTRRLPDFVPGAVCEETISLRFIIASIKGDHHASATRTSEIACLFEDANSDFSCQVVYEGNVPMEQAS